MDELTALAKTVLPGALGAASAVVLTRGALAKRSVMVLMASATAYYSYEYVAAQISLPTGLTSFLVGLFAAPFFDKAVDEIYQLQIAKTLTQWVKHILGLKESE